MRHRQHHLPCLRPKGLLMTNRSRRQERVQACRYRWSRYCPDLRFRSSCRRVRVPRPRRCFRRKAGRNCRVGRLLRRCPHRWLARATYLLPLRRAHRRRRPFAPERDCRSAFAATPVAAPGWRAATAESPAAIAAQATDWLRCVAEGPVACVAVSFTCGNARPDTRAARRCWRQFLAASLLPTHGHR